METDIVVTTYARLTSSDAVGLDKCGSTGRKLPFTDHEALSSSTSYSMFEARHVEVMRKGACRGTLVAVA